MLGRSFFFRPFSKHLVALSINEYVFYFFKIYITIKSFLAIISLKKITTCFKWRVVFYEGYKDSFNYSYFTVDSIR